MLKWVLYGFLLLMSAVFLLFVGGFIGLLPCALLLFLPLASAGYLCMLRGSLSTLCVAEPGCCKRDTGVSVTCVLRNTGRLIYPRVTAAFFVENAIGERILETAREVRLEGRAVRKFTFETVPAHLGTCRAGVSMVRVFDPLGLLSFKLACKDHARITVTPNCYSAEGLHLCNTNGSMSSSSVTKSKLESSDYSSTREYMPGDPMKSIHWKLSSHSPTLMTKVFESYSNNGLLILVDLNAPPRPAEVMLTLNDTLVESAASIAAFGIEHTLPTCLVASAGSENREFPVEHYEEIEEAAADFPMIRENPESPSDEVFEKIEMKSGFSHIMICTSKITKELITHVIALKNAGREPVIFYAVPGEDGAYRLGQQAEFFETVRKSGIELHVLTGAQDIERAVTSAS